VPPRSTDLNTAFGVVGWTVRSGQSAVAKKCFSTARPLIPPWIALGVGWNEALNFVRRKKHGGGDRQRSAVGEGAALFATIQLKRLAGLGKSRQHTIQLVERLRAVGPSVTLPSSQSESWGRGFTVWGF